MLQTVEDTLQSHAEGRHVTVSKHLPEWEIGRTMPTGRAYVLHGAMDRILDLNMIESLTGDEPIGSKYYYIQNELSSLNIQIHRL